MDKSVTELPSVTCHMGSRSVTCHPTQVSAPRLNPSHAGRYSIYLTRRDGRLSWPCYSETQPPGVELATSRSRIQRPNHWATSNIKSQIWLFFAHLPFRPWLISPLADSPLHGGRFAPNEPGLMGELARGETTKGRKPHNWGKRSHNI